MKAMTARHVDVVVFAYTSPTSSTHHQYMDTHTHIHCCQHPPLQDDRIPTVMHLYVCEGHPDRQGYHRHNLTAL